MIRRERRLPWVRGAAQDLPFYDGSLAAAYATWAYFFPEIGHGDFGLEELHRAVRPDGPLLMVDNVGEDEFSAYGDDPAAVGSNPAWWASRGFEREIVHTSFRFDDLEEARTLLGFYFGERGRTEARLAIGYDVAINQGAARAM